MGAHTCPECGIDWTCRPEDPCGPFATECPDHNLDIQAARRSHDASNMNRIFVPVTTDVYYRYIRSGKTVEIRNQAPRWSLERLAKGRPVTVRLGYSTKDEFHGTIGEAVEADRATLLPLWMLKAALLTPGDVESLIHVDAPVVAFEILGIPAVGGR